MSVPVAGLVPCPNHPEVTAGLHSCFRCGRNFCPDCLVNLGGALTCGDCKLERLSDLRSGSVELDYATPGARFVDVNSGVESAPGVKDHGKLQRLVERLHERRG